MKFFTWHDIECVFEGNRDSWPITWNDVKVYSDSVIIYYQENKEIENESKEYLKGIFNRNYSYQENGILIDFTKKYLEVIFEGEEGERRKKNYAPLFKDVYLSNFRIGQNVNELPGARILAFHSYKGGVGRTLSLVSLLRECTAKYPDKKLLVIDADLEAPGLTWMVKESGNAPISYLDILSVMNFETVTDDIICGMADLIKMSTLNVVTDKFQKEQFFIPVYRNKDQVMDIYSSPERILYTKENKFYITETLSRLGSALGVDMILVDLRAGITEYSAPFLFDPRVEKYYVTSTSMQSVKGLGQILEQVYRKTNADFLRSKIIMTMIPTVMKKEQIEEIEDQLLHTLEHVIDSEDATFLREDYTVRIEFDESLIHIDDFEALCILLQGKSLSARMKEQAEALFGEQENEKDLFTEEEIRESLRLLHEIMRDETAAEGSDSTNMLITSSIKEIARNFKTELPRIVVQGAKGSGKTYIYKQLLAARTWNNFVGKIEKNEVGVKGDGYIIPLLASINAKNWKRDISDCIRQVNEGLGTRVKSSFANDNFSYIQKKLEADDVKALSGWIEIWKDILLKAFEGDFHDLRELDEHLESKGSRVIYIIDGLEDLVADSLLEKRDGWKYSLRAICQYIVNELDNLDYRNIGIIVFARKDLMNEAIETNYEQFRSLYYKYELNWNQTEALRLALWLAAKACPELASNVDILNATREVLVDSLSRLWGMKLGRRDSREAFSDRWILAALSVFNGQLQARDIVRFLRYATASYREMKPVYMDRLIMPTEIRNAIEPCSRDKMQEIKAEMKNIYEILEKFMKMDSDKKLLPMTLDKIELTGEEIDRLESQGFLKISEKKYYMPEIIRLELGFRYEKGARPKVLSLLVQ